MSTEAVRRLSRGRTTQTTPNSELQLAFANETPLNPDMVVYVNGEIVDYTKMEDLRFPFDSYQAAIDRGAKLVIESYIGSEPAGRCVLWAGVCADYCEPRVESLGVCLSTSGQFTLNQYECPCDDILGDYFCNGGCSLTGPQD